MLKNVNKELIVVVLYQERLQDTQVYKTLITNEKVSVFIYDNSQIAQHNQQEFPTNWIYYSNPQNPGLGVAYNAAASYARDHGYEWLLITDQDTIYPQNILNVYRKAIEDNPDIRLFAPKISIRDGRFMSPVPMTYYRTRLQKNCPDKEINLLKYAIINSGLFVNVDAFFKAGGYNERVFLDFSDFQFIERFQNHYPTAFVIDAICCQNFSNETQSIEQKIARFKLFCKSLRSYECSKWWNRMWLHWVVVKRAISLCLEGTTIKPLIVYFKKFVCR